MKEKLKNSVFYTIYKKIFNLKLKIIAFIASNSISFKKFYLNSKLPYRSDIDNPSTFNEKIQFRKLYVKNHLFSLCSDKFAVRDYVKNKIGEEYLIPLLLVSEKLEREQWEQLPNKFVAKANHNSGPVQIVHDKNQTSFEKVSNELNRQLKEKFGSLSMETYYDDIKPLIIVEQLLDGDPVDYKFHCFKQKDNTYKIIIQVDYDRHVSHKRKMFDHEFNELPFECGYPKGNKIINAPVNFNRMLELAEKLASDFDYVRVDFYNVDGFIFFGELTFCHESGFAEFRPSIWDEKLGSYWD